MSSGAEESFGGVGESHIEFAGEIGGSGKIGIAEEGLDGEGAIFGGVHEGDGRAGDFGDGRLEQRVMGATEDEGIDAPGEEWFEIAREDLVGHGVVEQTFLDEWNEQGAGGAVNLRGGVDVENGLLVSAAGNRRPRSNDADEFVFRGGNGGLGAGEDHALDGSPENLLHAGDSEGRGGVAGDDDDFGVFGEEEFAEFEAVALHSLAAFSAIRDAGGVADVEDFLGGQETAEAGGDGEAADAGIEDANR